MNISLRWLLLLCLLNLCLVRLGAVPAGAEPPAAGANSPNPDKAAGQTALIPQNLLRLVHAPEVHRELGWSSDQVAQLEQFFQQHDGTWFRSRILPAEQQRKIVAELEGRLRQALAKWASPGQRQRLQQLEYQSQGVRMLLRPDVGERLGLAAEQREQPLSLARATQAAADALQTASLKGEAIDELQSAVAAAAQAEQAAVSGLLKPEQQQTLSELLGKPFDTAQLQRIYPMAPELVPVQHWINGPPLQLKALRGKVVILHFYAFQCHNCHANFGHYNRWHRELPSDQVVVIGIQTPETSRERDPAAVTAAAKEQEFQYPVLIDLESKNWQAWANTMWPTVYVIDQHGYLRFWWQGELNWQGATHDQKIEQVIEQLLSESDA